MKIGEETPAAINWRCAPSGCSFGFGLCCVVGASLPDAVLASYRRLRKGSFEAADQAVVHACYLQCLTGSLTLLKGEEKWILSTLRVMTKQLRVSVVA
ncbi:hypothetical protein NKR23_g1029 [Pleurostoma richardsiae]|uniref:Uncharacterized protein n=1 Tax=Pleurostoma richardsiae TaxID=41990 RepID=A0AA38RS06_9PEZI|nr:hypothetical protein NKR23_g1029 [Pleurostoma richardsiae]